MVLHVDTHAPAVTAEAFVRGEPVRRLGLHDFRGTWVVLELGARRADVLDLARFEQAFTADGAVVLAASPEDVDTVERRYRDDAFRFPVLAGVPELRRVTAIVDPDGVIQHAGLRTSARETLARLESLLSPAPVAA